MIIRTPSRLHMSLFDMNGSYKRIDGGIGLALQDPQFVLECEETEKGVTFDFDSKLNDEEAIAECTEKIPAAAQRTIEHFSIDTGFHFTVHSTYHPHSGLGSGTQIALATAKLITETVGISGVEGKELSTIVGRGGTSGIGTYVNELGGLIVDGGHSLKEKPGFLPSGASKASPPPLIARYDFPEEWDILVAMPDIDYYVNGQEEVNIFQTYCPIPQDEVEKVSHIVLMNLLPFLLEKDIKNVGWSVSQLQKYGFNNLEHSLEPHILPTMKAIEEAGAYGVGISSFGPAVYTFFDEENKDIVDATKEIVGEDNVFVTKAQNHGYVLEK